MICPEWAALCLLHGACKQKLSSCSTMAKQYTLMHVGAHMQDAWTRTGGTLSCCLHPNEQHHELKGKIDVRQHKRRMPGCLSDANA